MPRAARIIRKGLMKKGFRESVGDHKFYTYYTSDGLMTSIYTKISHSADDVSDSLLSLMAKQVRLSKNKFLEFVDCTIPQDIYQKLLIAEGVIKLT